jgi:peptide/nickel transport system substrate-binding protein
LRRNFGARPVVVFVALMLLAAACASGTGSGGSNASPGSSGFLKIGSTAQVDSMNPFVTFNSDPITMLFYEYPALVQYGKDLNFIPYFATSWSTSSDGTAWTFHTVPGAEWSDGQPMTANDVAWTYNTILKFANGPTSAISPYLMHVKSVVATNSTTVVVTYKQPVANVLFQLSAINILPEHVWSQYATGDGKGLKQYPATPQNGKPVVSGGPFMFTNYQQNQSETFQVNPHWWGQKPHITGFGLQYFATDDASVQALKTGEIDVLWANVPTTAVDSLKQAGFTVSVTPATTFHELNFNSNPAKTTYKELQNTTVRDAFANAIDFNQLVQTAWNGYAQPGISLIYPASGNAPGTDQSWIDPNLKTPTFDLTLAAQELDQAGMKMGPNGYRIAPGQPCTYSQNPCEHTMQYQVIIPHNELGSGMSMFQIIQTDMKKIGVGLTAKVLNDGAAWGAETANHYTSYNLSIWDWGCSTDPDCILSVLTRQSWYSWSDTAYDNPTYDKLYSEQGLAVNVQDRLKIVRQMQDIIYQDKPFIVLVYEDNRVAWNPSWSGFEPSPAGEFSSFSITSLLDAQKS